MIKFKELKPGDRLSEVQYYQVQKIKGDQVQLTNELGENIVVDRKYSETCLVSANQFTSTEKITKTAIAEKFLSSLNTVFTVNFTKQLTEESIIETLRTARGTDKEIAKKILAGEERTLVGRLQSSELNDLGYASVIDMEVEKAESGFDRRLRNINPRNINWMIVNNVKYQVK